ncbi:hypothetical protein [Pengzhenrongella sp.]|uniref:hypothetical protein n=1 Tax=Pengzhenrongella sp. TaxID=2888820 RepID=UPI002F93BC7C
MSTMLRPVGPNPPRVYWIRRIVVTVVFLAVVAGLVFGVVWVVAFVGARAAGSPAADPPAAQAPAAAAAANDANANKAPAIPVDCKAADLELSLVTDAATYPAGANPVLTATITNTGSKACTVDGGDVKRVLVVRSGGDRIWASKDCATADTASKQLLLAPGAREVAKVPWARDRSAKSCPSGLPAPKAGTYAATMTLLGVTTEPAAFTLQ